MLIAAAIAGAAAGLASMPHCAAMCGPLAGFACTRSSFAGRVQGPLFYQLGRSVGYALLGALVGAFGGAAAASLSGPWATAVLSWTFAAALLVVGTKLFRRTMPARPPVMKIGRGRPEPSVVSRLVARMPQHPALFGLLTGLLPCGALAAALLLAAGTASPWAGALLMLVFSATSGLALLGVGLLAQKAGRSMNPWVLRVTAVVLLVGAVVLIVRPLAGLRGEPASCCHGHATQVVTPVLRGAVA